MDTLPNNPHADIATGRLRETPAPGTAGASISAQIHFAADAITHALLALVYEQRTANLIALQQLIISAVKAGVTLDAEIAGIIDDRAGLGGES